MTRRRLLLLSVAAVGLVAVGLGVTVLVPDGRLGVTKANFDCITEGMPKAEVVNLLGIPSDRSPDGRIHWGELHSGKIRIGHEKVVWAGNDGVAVIVFDENGRALYMSWHDVRLTFVDRVRHWLRLP